MHCLWTAQKRSYLSREKEINDSVISKKDDTESNNFKLNNDDIHNFNEYEFDSIIQNHKGIMFTNEISFDEE